MASVIINGPIIAAGQSLSSAVDCTAGQIIRITTPAAWDGANISFQVSGDGNGFNNVYNLDGEEIVIPCGASRSIVLTTSVTSATISPQFDGVWLKIRSGKASYPVPQTAQREFAIAIQT